MTFRADIWGNQVSEEGQHIAGYWSGPGHPESFVPIPDGNGGFADGVTAVDAWFGLELILIDNGNGDWDVQTKIDVLSADGSTVAIDDYQVYNYSLVGGLDDGHTTHPPLEQFTDLYAATSLYPFIHTQAGAANNLAAIDDIIITIPEAGNNWYGYAVDAEGYANTEDWMGFVNVNAAPWIWSVSLSNWAYIGDDSGWVYIQK
jgi:hypothetical protein